MSTGNNVHWNIRGILYSIS